MLVCNLFDNSLIASRVLIAATYQSVNCQVSNIWIFVITQLPRAHFNDCSPRKILRPRRCAELWLQRRAWQPRLQLHCLRRPPSFDGVELFGNIGPAHRQSHAFITWPSRNGPLAKLWRVVQWWRRSNALSQCTGQQRRSRPTILTAKKTLSLRTWEPQEGRLLCYFLSV